MPYTAKQHRLFEAAAHDPSVAKRVGIPQVKAQDMAGEGVKGSEKMATRGGIGLINRAAKP